MSWRRNDREKRRKKKQAKVERVKASPPPKKRAPRKAVKYEHPADCICRECLFPEKEYEREECRRPRPWRPPT